MSKSTTIVTSTTALSNIADAIRADADKSGKIPTKQRMLNSAAKVIAGDKHDWGYLTGATGPVIQKGLPEARLRDLEGLGTKSGASATQATSRKLWAHDSSRPALTATAELTELYKGEGLALMKKRITGELIAVSETFYFDHENGTGLQVQLNPMAILSGDDTTGITPTGLWGASSKVQEMASAAYFASSANGDVNGPVFDIIENWDENLHSFDFMAFHMPHAVVIIPENPFDALSDMEINSPKPDDWDEGMIEAWEDEGIDPISFGFRVLIDKNLDPEGQRQAAAQVEDLLNRLAVYLNAKRDMRNIRVALPGDEMVEATAPAKGGVAVTSHVVTDMVHGGYDDAASLSLWIDEEAGQAHLCSHSGSMVPIRGPQAPSGAPEFDAIGKKGHCVIFEDEEVDGLRAALTALLGDYTPGQAESYRDKIEELLGSIDLADFTYKEYLLDYEPATHDELYGDNS